MSNFQPKACTKSELNEWISFLDSQFEYGETHSYGVDFAPLFEEKALPNSRLIYIDNKIAASATVYPKKMFIGADTLTLGVIGAVATHSDYRNQGMSSTIIEELEKIAQSLSLDGMILWSDKEEFYSRLGFHPAGQQLIYFLGALESAPKVSGKLERGWNLSEVGQIYNQHLVRSERSVEYWKSIERITSCDRYQWVDDTGSVKAYLGFNRGKDMQNVIHEWGGSAECLHALVSEVLKIHPNLMWLTHPDLNDPIRKKLPTDEKPVLKSHLGLMRMFRKVEPSVLEHLWFWGLDSL